MTPWQAILAAWPWEPSVVLGCGALLVAYLIAAEMRLSRRAGYFFAGVLVMLLALDSPLDTLADIYLFSAHMAQHLLLILIVPPLLLVGIPPTLLGSAWRSGAVGRAVRWLGHPGAAWALGTGTVWLWHIPALYNAALANGDVHVVQHLSFLATGVIFWWPVLAPDRRARLRPLQVMLYLFAAALASSVLGIILTFTPAGLYPRYLHPADPLGIEPFLRNDWGLSPGVDQQVGGLLMWIPGGLVYLCAMLGILIRWHRAQETDAPTRPGEGMPWGMV